MNRWRFHRNNNTFDFVARRSLVNPLLVEWIGGAAKVRKTIAASPRAQLNCSASTNLCSQDQHEQPGWQNRTGSEQMLLSPALKMHRIVADKIQKRPRTSDAQQTLLPSSENAPDQPQTP
jgi:hypothetical protein